MSHESHECIQKGPPILSTSFQLAFLQVFASFGCFVGFSLRSLQSLKMS